MEVTSPRFKVGSDLSLWGQRRGDYEESMAVAKGDGHFALTSAAVLLCRPVLRS